MKVDLLPTWRALADATRWSILQELATQPQTTGALAEKFAQTRFGVMKHLQVLCDANLVTFERRGRERWNYFNAAQIELAVSALTKPQDRNWARALLSLKNHIDQSEDAMQPVTSLSIRQELSFDVPAEIIFNAITGDIGLWWGEPYRQTAKGRLYLNPKVGGQFLETNDAGHAALWGTVEEVNPPSLLSLSGRFAVKGAVAGRVVFSLTEDNGQTTLSLAHDAVGMIPPAMIENFTQGWDDLLNHRLRAVVKEPAS
jgi:uncharacterized protein YndB with AHSA1/START domain/DNA-binding transcriptional ArsR family regulator